jgi:hypothetical protein
LTIWSRGWSELRRQAGKSREDARMFAASIEGHPRKRLLHGARVDSVNVGSRSAAPLQGQDERTFDEPLPPVGTSRP